MGGHRADGWRGLGQRRSADSLCAAHIAHDSGNAARRIENSRAKASDIPAAQLAATQQQIQKLQQIVQALSEPDVHRNKNMNGE